MVVRACALWDPHSSAMLSLPPVPSFPFLSGIFIMASLLSSWSGETARSLLKGKMRRKEHGSWVPVTLEGDRVVEMKDGRAPLCCLSTSSRSCSKFLGSNERSWLSPVSCVYLWVMCNSRSGSCETLGLLQPLSDMANYCQLQTRYKYVSVPGMICKGLCVGTEMGLLPWGKSCSPGCGNEGKIF